MEKGYRLMGNELELDRSLVEAGMARPRVKEVEFIGKAFAWALGAMGEQGVSLALEIIRKELDVSMALCGLKDVTEASPAILRQA